MKPRSTLPLADAPLFVKAARRTALVRSTLALALAAALAACAVVASRGHRVVARDDGVAKHTIVVLDLSGSITGDSYRRVGALLESLAANSGDGHRVGLVLFSDAAQEALPPETKAAELLAYARYFRPTGPQRRSTDASPRLFDASYPDNAWAPSFSSGTAISRGLELARRDVARDHLASARVLLVSDLFDADADHARLKTELLAYARTPAVELRVLPLPPDSEQTLHMFRSYLGERRVTLAPTVTQRVDAAGPTASFPVAFVVLVGVLAVALGANELVGASFRWREPQR